MRALVIADNYDPDENPPLVELAAHENVDVVITAGDLHGSLLSGITSLGIPAMGVYGNHCDGIYLERLGITNLHLSRIELHGISFTGLQGCVRYKPGTNDILYTQQEYGNMIEDLPAADVLVTHCPPRGVNDHLDQAHHGIDALRHWIARVEPMLVIHGHTYPDEPVTRFIRSRVEYVHGARVVTF